MSNTTASRLNQEIVRLKREVIRDDTQGHSCEQCQHITLKPIPKPMTGFGVQKGETSFLLDTTKAEVRGIAASGCNFWGMIWNQLALIDQEEKVKAERDKVSFDLKKYGSWWSDAHYKDLAASLGGDLQKELWHLRSSHVSWGFSAGGEMDFPVTQQEFVRVLIRYSSLNDFKNESVSIEVVLVLPARPVSTILFPHRGDLELQMVTYWTRLWVLSSPGEHRSPYGLRRVCPEICSRHPCGLHKRLCGNTN
jgi:hypothetical protein